jgi:2'-5' RNA ligase
MNRMYFIAHVLPDELNRKIHKLKLRMKDKFGCLTGLKSPAHITLVPPFWMNPDLETRLRQGIDDLAAKHSPFTITTPGFNCFRPKTIFIEPGLPAELERLKSASDRFILEHPEFNAETDERKFHPHITIATRDLQKKDFAEAWAWFENKNFEASWQLETISLLCHNKKNWDVVHTSQFKSAIAN